MKYYVIDSSVVIKWYIPEIFSEKAVNILYQIQQGRFKLMAPELILSY
jgi:predicted nucleic acid-binding protein